MSPVERLFIPECVTFRKKGKQPITHAQRLSYKPCAQHPDHEKQATTCSALQLEGTW